jgi:hypothetical protein
MNGTSTIKTHYEIEHFDILKCMLMRLYNVVLLKQMSLRNKVPKFKKGIFP